MTRTVPSEAVRASSDALVACGARIRSRGWCDGTSGNFSIVVGREPVRLLITPSGADKGALQGSDLLLVGGDGRPVDGGVARPSAECELHVRLASAGASAILHTHSVWGTLLGQHFVDGGGFWLTGYEMLKGIDGVRSHEEEVFVPVVPNSQDMREVGAALDGLLAEHPRMRGFLIAGHGLYTWGNDLDEAYRHVEIFEFLFQLAGRRLPLEPFTGQARSPGGRGG